MLKTAACGAVLFAMNVCFIAGSKAFDNMGALFGIAAMGAVIFAGLHKVCTVEA
jgi:hypothetical protein